MQRCDFGHQYTLSDGIGCQKLARYLLQYSVDWKLLEVHPNHPCAADMEKHSCENHVLDMDFVFEPNHGLPERIIDLKDDRERTDVVEEIESSYERWRREKYPE